MSQQLAQSNRLKCRTEMSVPLSPPSEGPVAGPGPADYKARGFAR